METTIAQIVEEFIHKLVKQLVTGKALSEFEKYAMREMETCTAKLTSAYMEHLDRVIAADKVGRRKAGYAIERRGDERKLQLAFGDVYYHRTYYRKESGGYEYLVDSTMDIGHHQRISEWLGLSLANAAKDMPYAKVARHVGRRAISNQSVMKWVRESTVDKTEEGTLLRRVPEIHIDADEAHITLCDGKRTEVPLISVYEGIGHHGKRHFCKSVFHVSEYGKTPDSLWEQAASELTNRYDLDGTRIYLHGDGAPWIRTGLEWLPGALFVLDKYHKNKAITAMTAGLDNNRRDKAEYRIRKALNEEDLDYFALIRDNLCQEIPERAEIIIKNAEYLEKLVKGVSICTRDPGANNGGCTEPHVSHVLSSRLSSRPMVWSKKTLQKLAPVLAAGKASSVGKSKTESMVNLAKPLRKTIARANKSFYREGTLGLPMPEAIGRLPITGKVTGLQVVLKHYAN